MKTLYISDLDGTLLDSNALISDYSVKVINTLIDKGLNFSVATARTSATACNILSGIKLNTPIILMNGVLVYDIEQDRFIKTESLKPSLVKQVAEILKNIGQTGFLYGITDNELKTYHEPLSRKPLINFVEERIEKYNKQFTVTDSFIDIIHENIIYICLLDIYENIILAYDAVKNIPGLGAVMYKDNYTEDLWFMECYSETASKRSAVQFLKQKYGFERVVSFGDNLNDLPMFEASDECYAVGNAVIDVKNKATAVIESNINDGVAKFLLNEFEE